MKFSLLCLSALASTTSAFLIPITQRSAAVSVSSRGTQLQVASEPEIMEGVSKPRRTRQVCFEVDFQISILVGSSEIVLSGDKRLT